MKRDVFFSFDRPNLLEKRVQELRDELSIRDAQQLAINTASKYESINSSSGYFKFLYWQEQTLLSHPGFVALNAAQNKELGVAHQALILYYFVTACAQPLTEKWISFAELPDGRFYTQAFQGYTGSVLSRHFAERIDQFEAAAKKHKGIKYPFADRSYLFWVFPRVPLLVVHWHGDEDFPPNYQILFDASVASYLPTDACAIAGSMLTRKLISTSP
ncbi:MAG: DUF3786 domain-containing protein [Anaerolineales bacterium]|nr:DUF3786 domain-containing protein [Anaerolineales bacterium]